MTIIHEEELEDSAFISNFNSQFSYIKQTSKEEVTHKRKNSDLSAVIEEVMP